MLSLVSHESMDNTYFPCSDSGSFVNIHVHSLHIAFCGVKCVVCVKKNKKRFFHFISDETRKNEMTTCCSNGIEKCSLCLVICMCKCVDGGLPKGSHIDFST